MHPRIPVLDGHNDTLTQIRNATGDDVRTFLERSDRGHIDLPRAVEGGLAAGFFAVFTASPDYDPMLEDRIDDDGNPIPGGWSVALPPPLDRRIALDYVLDVFSDFFRMLAASDGRVVLVRGVEDLARCRDGEALGVILHIEGAEAIDADLAALDVLHAAGLRSLGPVWSRPTIFGSGVPFDFPRSPDTGDGLTDAGRRLVARCNELGILVDLSHLNEKGFWDVAEASDAPLVATHSNAHALCPSPRNLTDEQLDAVADSGGLVGVNFHRGFLREDGRRDLETSRAEIVRHAVYMVERMGAAHVALGSDFDGATMPSDLADVTVLPTLLEELSAAGLSDADVRAIAWDNWIRVLEDTWPA